jgi:hypothetical protein
MQPGVLKPWTSAVPPESTQALKNNKTLGNTEPGDTVIIASHQLFIGHPNRHGPEPLHFHHITCPLLTTKPMREGEDTLCPKAFRCSVSQETTWSSILSGCHTEHPQRGCTSRHLVWKVPGSSCGIDIKKHSPWGLFRQEDEVTPNHVHSNRVYRCLIISPCP